MRHVILTNSIIQWRIQKYIGQVIDGGQGLYTSDDRLSRFRNWATAWKSSAWTVSDEIVYEGFNSDHRSVIDEGPNDFHSIHIFGSTLSITNDTGAILYDLPSRCRGVVDTRTWDMSNKTCWIPAKIHVDPDQDLLVILENMYV